MEEEIDLFGTSSQDQGPQRGLNGDVSGGAGGPQPPPRPNIPTQNFVPPPANVSYTYRIENNTGDDLEFFYDAPNSVRKNVTVFATSNREVCAIPNSLSYPAGLEVTQLSPCDKADGSTPSTPGGTTAPIDSMGAVAGTAGPRGTITPTKEISIRIVNNSISKGTTNYTIYNQRVEEGSTNQFDLNKFDDTTQIVANYDVNKYNVLNRFVIQKRGNGDVVLSEFEGDTPKDTKVFSKTPVILELNYRYETVVSTQVNTGTSDTFAVRQEFGFVTNYRQSPFNIRVESADLPSPLILKTDDGAIVTTNNRELRDVSFSVSNTGNYDLVALKWAYAGDDNFTSDGFRDGRLVIPSNRLTRNINVMVDLKPSENKIAGVQVENIHGYTISGTTLRSKFKTQEIQVPIAIRNAEGVIVKTPFGQRLVGATAGSIYENKVITLDLKTDFQNNIGSFKVVFISTNSSFGDAPNPGYTTINLSEGYDVPLINEIDFPDSITIPTYTLGEYPFNVQYRSDTADYVIVYHTSEEDKNIIGKYSKADTLNFNFNNLKGRGALNSASKIDFIFVPYDESNVNGQSVMEAIRGDETKITISVEEPALYISTDRLKQDFYNSIIQNIEFNLEDSPRYLNHITEFDKEDRQIVISNWDTDNSTFSSFRTDELGNQIPVTINRSIVLKLYEPLPTTINKNDTLWISKLMSLPLVRTITISSAEEQNLLFLRGPNFDIEVDFVKEQSTSFESLDNLILSGSITSQQIVDKYLYDNLFEVDKVNIDYSNFSNFVKYSSAVERLANFKYKKELIEYYDDRIFYLQSFTGSVTAVNEIVTYQTKKINLLNAFDGWENYLVSSSVSDFPKTDSFAQRFTSGAFNSNGEYNITYLQSGSNWFNSTLSIAQSFDTNNRNSLKNNIPLHLIDSGDNEQYLLFLDMVGHHFDVIWSYINGMSDTKNITEINDYGIHDDFLYDYLKSFGWDAKNVNSNEQLWKYLFGKNADGVVVQENTAEERTKLIWRRIANNLPYLLKNKGTKRGISALLNCYGIAGSNLSIVEFGGPDTDDALESTKYIYDTQTANLNFISGSYLTTRWSGSNAIELRIKPAYSGSGMTLVSGSSFKLSLVPGNHTSQTSGSLELAVSSSTGVQTIVTNQYQFYDENYHSILLNRETQGTSSTFTFYFKNGEKDRIIKSGSYSAQIDGAIWNTGSTVQLGGTYVGEMDEFRMWNTALSESAFDLHVLHPEAINGNHISSSTTDLQVRLDFEWPKNLALTASVKNVAPNNTYQSYVSASGFNNIASYPHQYEIVDRTVSLEVPNSGASRYSSNKVRFEDQTLVSDLSYKSRSTLKAFETSKRDSNRLGIFFSPNKDLDLDIAKSFGGISIDNYIGAYDDQYQDTYKDLTDLRNYYFERIGERDIYQFINLVRLYDKSLFVNLKQMLPARVKATTGLLIAPHLLERSKHKVHKPIAEDVGLPDMYIDTTETTLISSDVNIYDAQLSLTSSTTLIGEFNNYTTSISLETPNTLEVENNSYEGTITDFDINAIISTDNYFETNQTASIDTRIISGSLTAEFELLGSTIVNVGELYSDIGYSSYFDNGYTRLNYQDYDGTYKSKKVRGFIVTRRSDLIIPMIVDGVVSEKAIYEDILTDVFTNELILQEGNQTASLANELNIVSITTASGYLKSHYIYNKDRSVGLENTFFRGSKQTTATTIDGRAAIEEFASNPTILRVNENGRPNNEPILVVD
jgi:hypothetical protein